MEAGAATTLLVEDHELVRMGLRKMLEKMPGISIVAEAATGKVALAKALELRPELVLMDIGLPDGDGIETTRAIKAVLPTKVILITSHDEGADVVAGLSAGADAYCLKGVSAKQLTNAITSVLDNAMWLDPNIARLVVQAAHRQGTTQLASQQESFLRFGLSERELEIVRLLVDGLSNQEMAQRLYLSTETVKTHMRHVMEKLCARDRTQAAVRAVQAGLISS